MSPINILASIVLGFIACIVLYWCIVLLVELFWSVVLLIGWISIHLFPDQENTESKPPKLF